VYCIILNDEISHGDAPYVRHYKTLMVDEQNNQKPGQRWWIEEDFFNV